MARPLRDQSAGVRHVTCRGNRRQPIFDDDYDRERYLVLLAKVARKYRWRLLAYCLMTNHVHLVIDVPEGTISRGMQLLSGQYAQGYNRRHGWTGHLFQGRFHSVNVETEEHAMFLVRYVDLNPERAGMVEEAVEWRWSSHQALLGLVKPQPFLDTRWTLSRFGPTADVARASYADWIANGRETGPLRPRPGQAPRNPRGQTPGGAPPGQVPDD